MATGQLPDIGTERMRIGFDSAGIVLSPDEFDAIDYDDCDECYRYELIHGVLVVNPIPLEESAGPNELLGHLLYIYQTIHPKGTALDDTLPGRYIHLPDSRRQADRVIWAGLGRRPDPRNDVPTIAVEFVSAGKRNATRDYELKRAEYRDAGVVEYWIVDRFRRTMTVHHNADRPAPEGARNRSTSEDFRGKDRSRHKPPLADDPPTTRVVAVSETYETDLLPGFVLPLGKLLAEADKWGEG